MGGSFSQWQSIVVYRLIVSAAPSFSYRFNAPLFSATIFEMVSVVSNSPTTPLAPFLTAFPPRESFLIKLAPSKCREAF